MTLYGGSVQQASTISPAIKVSTAVIEVESPQCRRWVPRIQVSPGTLTGSATSGASSGSVRPGFSGSPANIAAISSLLNPVNSMSKPNSLSASSSTLSMASSQPALSANLLSAIT
ncbi:hypothetical protein D3C84_1038020 [compost metagenome]